MGRLKVDSGPIGALPIGDHRTKDVVYKTILLPFLLMSSCPPFVPPLESFEGILLYQPRMHPHNFVRTRTEVVNPDCSVGELYCFLSKT